MLHDIQTELKDTLNKVSWSVLLMMHSWDDIDWFMG